MMARTLYLAVSLVVGSLAGSACVTASHGQHSLEPPSWTQSGHSRAYPKARYLVGVGEGDTRDAAVERARAEIAKQFEVRVQSETVVTASSSHKEGASDSQWMFDERRSDVTRSTADQTLEGMSVPEVWLDPVTARHYALAVLDRVMQSKLLTTQIRELDQAMASALQQAGSAAGPMERMRGHILALGHHLDRSALRARLATLDQHAWQATKPSISSSELAARIRSELRSLDVRLEVRPKSTASRGKLNHALEQAVSRYGLMISRGAKTAAILVEVDLEESVEPQAHERFRFWRMEARLRVVDNSSGRIIGATTIQAREGALTESDARNRAQLRIADAVLSDFEKFLRLLLYGSSPGD